MDRNELQTRLEMIDVLLKEQGWIVSDRSRVLAEIDTKQSDFVAKSYKTVSETLKNDMESKYVDYLLLDKGFNSGKIVSVLNKSGCNYVMPAVNNSRVLHYIRINSVGKTGRFEIESDGTFTYLAVAMGKKGKKIGYFVNSERTCVAHYKRRWGIETSYRKIKEDFQPKTTSKNPIVRLFYFLLAETLCNLWLLSNLIIQPVQGQPFLKYLQTAKQFGYDLWSLLMTNESGPPYNNYSQFSGPPSIPSC